MFCGGKGQAKEVQAWSSQHQPSTQPGHDACWGVSDLTKQACVSQTNECEMLAGPSKAARRVPQKQLHLDSDNDSINQSCPT